MQLYYDDQSTNSINIFGTYCQLSALQGYNKTLLLRLVKKKHLHVLQQKPQCFLRLKVFSEILFLAYSGKKRQAYLPINAGSYDGTGYAHLSATKFQLLQQKRWIMIEWYHNSYPVITLTQIVRCNASPRF